MTAKTTNRFDRARYLYGDGDGRLPCIEHEWRLAKDEDGIVIYQCEHCPACSVAHPHIAAGFR